MPKRRPGQAAKPVAPSKPIPSTPPSQPTTETRIPKPAAATAPSPATEPRASTPVMETTTPASEQALVTSAPETSRKPALHIVFPAWPVSKPGPRVTPPPPGMRSINSLRPEQVVEIGYDQETGESALRSSDQTHSADLTEVTQNVVSKRQKKERL